MESVPSSKPRLVNVIRWIARALSACIILFFSFLFTVEGISSGFSTDISTVDIVALVLAGIELIGLGLAFAKWELLGGVITLLAFISKGVVNPLTFKLVFLTPVPATLFLVSWWLSRPSQLPEPNVDQTH